jgi:hypothetical protein
MRGVVSMAAALALLARVALERLEELERDLDLPEERQVVAAIRPGMAAAWQGPAQYLVVRMTSRRILPRRHGLVNMVSGSAGGGRQRRLR